MPPWHAAHGFGEFIGERRLTNEQIALISKWVAQGMHQGDPAKIPSLPDFSGGWELGPPDLIVKMPKPYPLPASGPDVYRNFAIPLNLSEDKWVRAVALHPSARAAVHHLLLGYDVTGRMRKRDGADGMPGFFAMGIGSLREDGILGGGPTGQAPIAMPEGLAYRLPKGADLLLQEHFHLTGKPEEEQTTIGVYFTSKPSEKRLMFLQIPALFAIGDHLDIPPGDKDYRIKESLELPVDVQVYTIGAHAHYLGKEMKAVATTAAGTEIPLLWIRDWDFAWQDRFVYKTPVLLPKGTRIDVELRYDNSNNNLRNPSHPPKRVLWGEGTTDEMGGVLMQIVAVNKEDEAALSKALQAARTKAALSAVADGTVDRLGLLPPKHPPKAVTP